MITAPEERPILHRAYVPEHVPGYVRAISGAEPCLLGEFLYFRGEDSLLFNGYPLEILFDATSLGRAIESVVLRYKPRHVALIVPKIPETLAAGRPRERDQCYRLDLARVTRDAKLRDRIFSARDRRGALIACDVAEFGARDFAFYQFNFRSRTQYVPGGSDLLLDAVISATQSEGKRYLNLGLGIKSGVRRVKEKWGGQPFLPYENCRYSPGRLTLFDALLQKL